jgi:hypothetical protein
MKSKLFTLLILLLIAVISGCSMLPNDGQDGVDGQNGNSVFIRWGSDTAPPGCTLIYSGFAYGSFYSFTGQLDLIVVQSGDPTTDAPTGDGSLLYPVETASDTTKMPPGITGARYVKAAVCWTNAPTMTIWGTHTPPAGWAILYKGFAMGGNYTHETSLSPICVDYENFYTGSVAGGNTNCLLYGIEVQASAPGDTSLEGKYLKCAVVYKLP